MNTLPLTGATERQVHQAVRELIEGRSNAAGTVTLRASYATTTIEKPTINKNAIVILTPATANAAAEIGNGTMYVTVAAAGGAFTITHANNAQTNRTFGYLVIGG